MIIKQKWGFCNNACFHPSIQILVMWVFPVNSCTGTQSYDVVSTSTKPHLLECLGAASPTQLLEKRRLHERAFRRRMSLYTTQLQGPVMAATGEQSCLKLTFVSLAIDPRTVDPSVSSGQISAETEATQTLIALELQ